MRLFEYQGKELFSRYGIPVPRGVLALDPPGAAAAARELGLPSVVKAQVLSGGRGKAGGVALVRTIDETEREAGRILGMTIGGEVARSILVEEALEHTDEFYLSVSLDRSARGFVALASRGGGVEVESRPGTAMARVPVPLGGLTEAAASALAEGIGLEGRAAAELRSVVLRLERLAREEECELAEINPLAAHPDGSLVALDSKVVLDDNALFRHPEFSKVPPEDPVEGEAARRGFALVRLGGDVAVVGNGAGLILSTIDLVADAGGKPACFLDLGGGAQRERVEAALRLVRGLGARAVLINIFGGITETVDVAQGIEAVLAEGGLPPVFARIRGADEAKARSLLEAQGVPVFKDSRMAVEAAVRCASG